MRTYTLMLSSVPWMIAAGLMLASCNKGSQLRGGIPSLALKTYAGEAYPITSGDSIVTLLVFWATWCQPCLMEIPTLVVLQDKFRSRGFRVVSINIDDPVGGKALPIMQRFGVNYPVLAGNTEATRVYGGVNALPTSFIIGRDGKIKEKIQGLLPAYQMEEKIAAQF